MKYDLFHVYMNVPIELFLQNILRKHEKNLIFSLTIAVRFVPLDIVNLIFAAVINDLVI